ncbi:MAG: hypothetical protein ACRDOL_21310, partial [Streptosporangiaceae bacterium]
MTDPTPAQRLIGDFAPKLVDLTDNVLFGDVWGVRDKNVGDWSVTWPGLDGLSACRCQMPVRLPLTGWAAAARFL